MRSHRRGDGHRPLVRARVREEPGRGGQPLPARRAPCSCPSPTATSRAVWSRHALRRARVLDRGDGGHRGRVQATGAPGGRGGGQGTARRRRDGARRGRAARLGPGGPRGEHARGAGGPGPTAPTSAGPPRPRDPVPHDGGGGAGRRPGSPRGSDRGAPSGRCRSTTATARSAGGVAEREAAVAPVDLAVTLVAVRAGEPDRHRVGNLRPRRRGRSGSATRGASVRSP